MLYQADRKALYWTPFGVLQPLLFPLSQSMSFIISNMSNPSILIKSVLSALSYFHVFDNGSLDLSQYRDKADEPMIFYVLLAIVFYCAYLTTLRWAHLSVFQFSESCLGCNGVS